MRLRGENKIAFTYRRCAKSSVTWRGYEGYDRIRQPEKVRYTLQKSQFYSHKALRLSDSHRSDPVITTGRKLQRR